MMWKVDDDAVWRLRVYLLDIKVEVDSFGLRQFSIQYYCVTDRETP